VTTTVSLVIKILTLRSILGYSWFVLPAVFIIAVSLSAIVKGNKFPAIGLNKKMIGDSLILLFWTCVGIFPIFFTALIFLRLYGFGLPLQPMLPQGQSWLCWFFYQFFYVAVAEEVFFRGYLQVNFLKLAGSLVSAPVLSCESKNGGAVAEMAGGQRRFIEWISIILSAACFALAHIIVQGQFISVLTFLSGLVLGWLFVRSGALFAPILFHGLANSCYALIAAALVL
jgi:membrane protease YdiL (CAAX protease family)